MSERAKNKKSMSWKRKVWKTTLDSCLMLHKIIEKAKLHIVLQDTDERWRGKIDSNFSDYKLTVN